MQTWKPQSFLMQKRRKTKGSKTQNSWAWAEILKNHQLLIWHVKWWLNIPFNLNSIEQNSGFRFVKIMRCVYNRNRQKQIRNTVAAWRRWQQQQQLEWEIQTHKFYLMTCISLGVYCILKLPVSFSSSPSLATNFQFRFKRYYFFHLWRWDCMRLQWDLQMYH